MIAGSRALCGEWHEYGIMPLCGLPLYAAWGFEEVGVFFDYTSLYQQPRDVGQEASFRRAIAWISLSRLAGTLLAQVLFVPAAIAIVWVANLI